jgi:hypothetical protein
MPDISPNVLDVWDAMTEAFILSVLYTVMSMVGCLVTLVNEMHIISQMSFCLHSLFAIMKLCI